MKKWKVLLIVLGGLIVLGIVGNFLPGKSSQSAKPAPTSSRPPSGNSGTGIPADVRTYIGAAGGYLTTAHQQAMHIALVANGLNDGSTTLSDLKGALQDSREIENAGYAGDYVDRIGVHVPAQFGATAKDIQETHRLFQDSTAELLAYWKDQNVAHIASGQATMARCVMTINQAIAGLTQEMDAISAKRRAGTSKR